MSKVNLLSTQKSIKMPHGPPSKQVQETFPYSQEQYQSLDAVLKKLNFLSALTESLMSLVKTLSQSQSRIAKSHQTFAKSLQKQFLSLSKSVAASPTSPNAPTLESLESKLSQYSQLYSKAALKKSTDSQELLSSLSKKRTELKKVIKTFKKDAKTKWDRICQVRENLAQEISVAKDMMENDRASKKKKGLPKKYLHQDPWLFNRALLHDYPEALKKENEFQNEMLQLIHQMLDFDGKLVTDLDTISSKYAPPGFVPQAAGTPMTPGAPTPTTAKEKGKAPAHQKSKAAPIAIENILDPKIWQVDRVQTPPIEMPAVKAHKVLKQGLLKRNKAGTKWGQFVLTDTGYLHCFKIKKKTSSSETKKSSLLMQDDSLLSGLVRHGDKDLGFERKEPCYSLSVSDIRLKSMNESSVEIQVTRSGACGPKVFVYPIGFESSSLMKEWTQALKLSFYTAEGEHAAVASAEVKEEEKNKSELTKEEKDTEKVKESTDPASKKEDLPGSAKDESKENESSASPQKGDLKDKEKEPLSVKKEEVKAVETPSKPVSSPVMNKEDTLLEAGVLGA